ncbi:MAG: hypothetical protein U1E89_18800 [Burkholderiaceae bacterium]
MARWCVSGCVAAALLAACGASPGDDRWFPLADGHVWTYRVTLAHEGPGERVRETLTLRTRGADTVGGARAWRRRSDGGVDYWLRVDDSGIFRVATKSDIEREPRLDEAPRYVLRAPYVAGTEWEAATTAYVLQRRNEFPQTQYQRNHNVPMHYRIEAVGQTVATPARAFEGCLLVVGRAQLRIFVDAQGAWRDSPLTTREWYCPGVGLVRLEREELSASKLLNGGTLTLELVSWH